MTPTDSDVEAVARALCAAEYFGNEYVWDDLGETEVEAFRLHREKGNAGPLDSKEDFREAARAAIAADPGRKRMREALEAIARMKVHPDGKACQMTLAAAIETARKAVEGADRG